MVKGMFCYIAMVSETETRKRPTLPTSPSSLNMTVASEVLALAVLQPRCTNSKVLVLEDGVEITGARRVSMQHCSYKQTLPFHTLPSVDAKSSVAADQVDTYRFFGVGKGVDACFHAQDSGLKVVQVNIYT